MSFSTLKQVENINRSYDLGDFHIEARGFAF